MIKSSASQAEKVGVAVFAYSAQAAGFFSGRYCAAELDRFEESWGAKYPLIIRSWRSNWDEFATFFKYPPELRKLIYTTNMIESYHRQLHKVTKGKSIFPADESLPKMLYLVTMDVTRKWTRRVQNWGQMLLQLSVFYPAQIGQHLP